MGIIQTFNRNRKSKARFLALEDEILLKLREKGRLTGNYGSAFNELSYRLSNTIELIALKHVKGKEYARSLRTFSPNPDLFSFAAKQGMKTSTYIAFEGKSDEAKERILGKIEAFLCAKNKENALLPYVFEEVLQGIQEILVIRYPSFFSINDELEQEVSCLLKGEGEALNIG